MNAVTGRRPVPLLLITFALLGLCAVLGACALATDAVVVDPCFEDVTDDNRPNAFTSGPLTGWDLYAGGGTEYGFEQTLDEGLVANTPQANTIYTV